MKKNITALLIFIFLTALMTYPVILKMKNHITGDLQDSLLNAWVLGWDIHKICTGLSGYWNANIFYPYDLTLTFSEHLTGVAIFGLPIMLLTDNIIFTYNFLFLFTFVLSGFGSFLLVRYLTKNFWAGIISGIIFAFVPFRFGQICHPNVLNVQWIPFVFLYLHKFFEKFSSKYLVLFALFYILQFISSLYIGLFISIFVMFFFLYYIFQKRIIYKMIFLRIILTFVFVGIVLFPFTYPYLQAKKQFGFERSIYQTKKHSAHIESYLSARHTNLIYGKLTHKLRRHGGYGGGERELFAGFVALFLAFVGLWRGKIKIVQTRTNKKHILLVIWYVLTVFYSLTGVIFLFTGGEPVCLFGKKILSHCGIRSFTNVALLIIIRLCLDKSLRRKIIDRLKSINQNERFYFLTIISAMFLSFGPQIYFFREDSLPGPYILLYYLVPGFDGVRAVSRFGVVFLFGISVLAGYGYNKLLEKFDSKIKKTILGTFLIVISLIEYLSVPVPTAPVKVGENIPAVYKWLSKEKGDFPIIEFPLCEVQSDFMYTYFSSYHRKKILNGTSSHSPPIYNFLATQSDKFPSTMFLGLLKKLGIKYVIIHSAKYRKSEWKEMSKKLSGYKNKISFIGKFESDFVYEIANSSFSLIKPEGPNPKLLIPKEGWCAESNFEGPRQPGAYFLLDLGKVYEFNRIWLSLGNKYNEYPENYTFAVSEDNKNWKVIISEGNISPELFLDYLFCLPRNVKIDIKFYPQKARYMKITQYGKQNLYGWTIYEIDVQRIL